MTEEAEILDKLCSEWIRQDSAFKPFHVMEEKQKNMVREFLKMFIKNADAAGYKIVPKNAPNS